MIEKNERGEGKLKDKTQRARDVLLQGDRHLLLRASFICQLVHFPICTRSCVSRAAGLMQLVTTRSCDQGATKSATCADGHEVNSVVLCPAARVCVSSNLRTCREESASKSHTAVAKKSNLTQHDIQVYMFDQMHEVDTTDRCARASASQPSQWLGTRSTQDRSAEPDMLQKAPKLTGTCAPTCQQAPNQEDMISRRNPPVHQLLLQSVIVLLLYSTMSVLGIH